MNKSPETLLLTSPITIRTKTKNLFPEHPYNKPIFQGDAPIGLVRFKHRLDRHDRFRYVNRNGQPCFGSSWFRTARFFAYGFAAVTYDTHSKSLTRAVHITETGKPAYSWRFQDIGDVQSDYTARVLHPSNSLKWLVLDLDNMLFYD